MYIHCIYTTCFFMKREELVSSGGIIMFSLSKGFQAFEEAPAARECNSSSSADLHTRLPN